MVLKCKKTFHITTSELNNLAKEGHHEPADESNSLILNKGHKCLFPKRYIFALMNCIACFNYTSHVTNMTFATVAMVNLTAFPSNNSRFDECPAPIEIEKAENKGGDILWSPQIVGFILGATFIGCMITKIPGGRLAERVQCKKLIGFSITISSLLTMLIPVAARWGSFTTMAVRFLTGLALGPLMPDIVFMLGYWIPKTEKNLLSSLIFSGYTVGSCINPLIFASLCDSNFLGGWPSVFYVSGFCGLCVACFWFLLIHETPSQHPTITDQELKYILENSTQRKKNTNFAVPWMKMMTSVRIWALISGYFMLYWSFGIFVTVHSLYLGTILHMSLIKNGIHSSLPRIFRLLFQWVGAFFTHWMLKKGYARSDVVLKSWIAISGVLSLLSFLGITLVGCNETLITLFFTLSYCLSGIVDAELKTTCSNMVPAFAGTMSAIAEFIGTSNYFIIPALVGYLTEYEQTMAQWNKVFYISMAVFGSTSLFFVLFGTSEAQSWAIQPDDEKRETPSVECQTEVNK